MFSYRKRNRGQIAFLVSTQVFLLGMLGGLLFWFMLLISVVVIVVRGGTAEWGLADNW